MLGLASNRQGNASNSKGEDKGTAIGRSVDLTIEWEGKSLFSLRHSHLLRVRGREMREEDEEKSENMIYSLTVVGAGSH